LSKEKILIVDDEKMLRELLYEVLVEEGYEVITAYNGEEAIKKIHKHNIDLALVDIKMPILGGMEVLWAIKEFDPNIGVIMMTAYGELETAILAMELGAYDYLLKPFDNLEVIGIIVRKWLDHRRSILKKTKGE
jgi:two-component system NtrC family response regulator